MDSTVFESILEIFRDQISLQQELQEQAKRMRSVILSRDMDQIAIISHTIDQITAETETLEIERREIIAVSGLHESANKSFAVLIRSLPEEQAAKLIKIHKTLKETVKETTRFTTSNRVILKEILSSIRANIEVIAGTAKPSTGYDNTGKSSNNKRKFLNQIG